MHLEVLVEEPSAKNALEILLPKMIDTEQHAFTIHDFGSKQRLLGKLEDRLRGYAAWVPDDWRIVVLVDEDRADCKVLKQRLVEAAENAGISQRVLNRIAIEELEAWFFGDIEALRQIYPRLPKTLHKKEPYRDPDAIGGGTWEALDRVLIKFGYKEGLVKTETARRVARHMDLQRNRSKSFQVFWLGIIALCEG